MPRISSQVGGLGLAALVGAACWRCRFVGLANTRMTLGPCLLWLCTRVAARLLVFTVANDSMHRAQKCTKGSEH